MSDEERARTGWVLLQGLAAALGLLAIVWGIACWYTILYPGPSGEWAVHAYFFLYVVDFPAGLLVLAAVGIRRGSRSLRRTCLGFGVVTLSLPLFAWMFHWFRSAR